MSAILGPVSPANRSTDPVDQLVELVQEQTGHWPVEYRGVLHCSEDSNVWPCSVLSGLVDAIWSWHEEAAPVAEEPADDPEADEGDAFAELEAEARARYDLTPAAAARDALARWLD